jgi:hypothetical protein
VQRTVDNPSVLFDRREDRGDLFHVSCSLSACQDDPFETGPRRCRDVGVRQLFIDANENLCATARGDGDGSLDMFARLRFVDIGNGIGQVEDYGVRIMCPGCFHVRVIPGYEDVVANVGRPH